MKVLAPLFLILVVMALLLAISYFNSKATDKAKKGVLNITQVFILLFIWKFSSYVYVQKLEILASDNMVYIPVLIIAAITAIINCWSQIKIIFASNDSANS